MAHVTLTTDVKSFALTSFEISDAAGNEVRIVQTTRPTDNSSTVIGTSLNYLKLKFYSSASSNESIFVWGWSFWPDQMAWVPQLLCSFTMVPNGSTSTVPGVGTVYEMVNATKLTGDVKIYAGVGATSNGGFVLVDTLGCQFVEVVAGGNPSQPVISVLSSGL
jgi:hypothetical protein